MYSTSLWGYDQGQLEEWTSLGKHCLQSVSTMADADYVVFPKLFVMDAFDELQTLSAKAKQYGKQVLVFYVSDIDTSIFIDNILVFRTSITTNNTPNEYCLPAFPGDALSYATKHFAYTIGNSFSKGLPSV